MKSEGTLKELVREKYATIAKERTSCCGGDKLEYSMIGDAYEGAEGYVQDADLQLGCGLPTKFAKISAGDTVVDLGCGAGNDVFIARSETGAEGHVIGIDFTTDMLDLAKKNAAKLGYENVSFVHGDIEEMPIEDSIADVVVSNCVLNLVPDKSKAYAETFRILKAGGHFSISDIVTEGNISPLLREQAEMYAGCVSGAIPIEDYMDIVSKSGFVDIEVQKKRQIELPDEILDQYLSKELKSIYQEQKVGIFSITLFARKPE